jgi:nucleoid-associated protein Lsr2
MVNVRRTALHSSVSSGSPMPPVPAAMEKALKPYIDAGNKVRRSPRPAKTETTKYRLSDVRAWAAANGIEVSPRGRIPKNVIDRYESARS